VTGVTNVGDSLFLTSDLIGYRRLSVANTALFGAEFLGYKHPNLGAQLSVLGKAYLSWGLELPGNDTFLNSISVLDGAQLLAGLTVSSGTLLDGSLSVVTIGSRVGAELAVAGVSEFLSTAILQDAVHFASSLSVTSAAAFGSSLSVLGDTVTFCISVCLESSLRRIRHLFNIMGVSRLGVFGGKSCQTWGNTVY
jgi:hypothetical protein